MVISESILDYIRSRMQRASRWKPLTASGHVQVWRRKKNMLSSFNLKWLQNKTSLWCWVGKNPDQTAVRRGLKESVCSCRSAAGEPVCVFISWCKSGQRSSAGQGMTALWWASANKWKLSSLKHGGNISHMRHSADLQVQMLSRWSSGRKRWVYISLQRFSPAQQKALQLFTYFVQIRKYWIFAEEILKNVLFCSADDKFCVMNDEWWIDN